METILPHPRRSGLRLIWSLLRRARRMALHPIFIFTVLQIVIVTATVIWVVWFAQKNPDPVQTDLDLAFLTTGIVLSGITLIGTVFLFVFAIGQARLNRQQRTSLVPSPMNCDLHREHATHLDTFELRNVGPDVMRQSLGMMRADLTRLMKLVDQILVSSRLDRGMRIFETIEVFALEDVIRQCIQGLTHLDPGFRSVAASKSHPRPH